jgi:hypothetical protein
VTEPGRLLADPALHRRFGEVLAVEELANPGWYPTRLAYYVDGKIDFIISPASDIGVDTYDEAFRVLVDKDQAAQHLPLVPTQGALPTGPEFSECVNWFYAAAIMVAGCVVRNEPWLAKARDWDTKQELLKMIEWDHRAATAPTSARGTSESTSAAGWTRTCKRNSSGAGELFPSRTLVPPCWRRSSCTTGCASGRRPRSVSPSRRSPRHARRCTGYLAWDPSRPKRATMGPMKPGRNEVTKSAWRERQP